MKNTEHNPHTKKNYSRVNMEHEEYEDIEESIIQSAPELLAVRNTQDSSDTQDKIQEIVKMQYQLYLKNAKGAKNQDYTK